jgi:hypothetical protein
MFYTGVSTLIADLPNSYFELCDPDLDLESDENLLIFWNRGVEKYYGIFELTYTAHVHLHLPQQV